MTPRSRRIEEAATLAVERFASWHGARYSSPGRVDMLAALRDLQRALAEPVEEPAEPLGECDPECVHCATWRSARPAPSPSPCPDQICLRCGKSRIDADGFCLDEDCIGHRWRKVRPKVLAGVSVRGGESIHALPPKSTKPGCVAICGVKADPVGDGTLFDPSSAYACHNCVRSFGGTWRSGRGTP